MPPLAYFGIESSGLSIVVDLVVLSAVVLWLALAYWAFADSRRRIEDPALVGLATLVAFIFPFVGALVYAIVRPPEFIEDVRERELEMQAAQARLSDGGHEQCPYCEYRIERDFVRCPSCLRKLKERCVNCARPLDQAWTICPYCEADVPGLAGRRPRRRRAAQLDGELSLETSALEPAREVGAATLAGETLAGEPPLSEEISLAGDRLGGERRAAERRSAAAARAAARAASRPRPAP